MSFITGRLRRLEERSRGGRCQECGLPPDGPGRIVTVEGDLYHDPQERCSECVRFLWTTIKIVYEDGEDNDAA
jgi:hypothetical protein